MISLTTERLVLVATPLAVLQTRLECDTFVADLPLVNGNEQVKFPAEWPGDALGIFPIMIDQLQRNPSFAPWDVTVVDRAEHVAVGQMGCKALPDAQGMVEIGYGVNKSCYRRGYATEMVGAFISWLLAKQTVRCVTAECRTDNIGSMRVLEKSAFERIGQRVDPEDGPLIMWQRKH